MLRWLGLYRGIGVSSSDGFYPILGDLRLRPAAVPAVRASVFFYLPDYAPPGELVEQGLVAPELQITNDDRGGLAEPRRARGLRRSRPQLAENVSADVRIELGGWAWRTTPMRCSIASVWSLVARCAGDPPGRSPPGRPALRTRTALYLALISDHVVS